MERMHLKYKNEIIPEILKERKLKNVMEVPSIKKIAVNVGIGSFRENREAVESFTQELANICGQKPYPRKAKKSEAGFKIRGGDIVGLAVTLRGDRMWAFLDKLVNIALPRVRDFRGLSNTSFDGNGNYSIGIREHVIFPEIDQNIVKGIRSLQLTMVTNSKNKELNELLLRKLGLPFRKDLKAPSELAPWTAK